MKKIIIITLIISGAFAQNIGNFYLNNSNESDISSIQLSQDIDLTNNENLTYTPIEKSIDPNTYILGPGDLLGINIISTKNLSLPIRVNPVGEIMIPSIGVLHISGISLLDAKIKISNYIIETALQNAVVSVTLLDVRRFKIQVLGAVHNPGFIYLTPIDKVYDAILQSGGVQKFAHPTIVKVIRNERPLNINLQDYLSGKDISQNILIESGDIVIVPFNDYTESLGLTSYDINNNYVVVYGFISSSGGGNIYKYYPGYTVRDYIAMAGGPITHGKSFKSGNINRAILYRTDHTKIKNAINELVLPGDMIEVPPHFLYQIFGGDGALRTLTTLTSIASSIYIIDSIINKDK